MTHPLRAQILRLLVERGVSSPSELARALGEDLRNVSYHTRRLEELGCAEEVETRPVRGTVQHFYRAIERHLIDTHEWDQLDPIVAEDMVCGNMQLIVDDFVASKKAAIVGSDKNFHLTRTPMNLDAEGYEEGMAVFERCRLEMSEVERRSAERREDSGVP